MATVLPAKIRRRTGRRVMSTTFGNEIADTVNRLPLAHAPEQDDRPYHVTFLARVTDAGPNGENDYANELYWVAPLYIVGAGPNDRLAFGDDPPLLGTKIVTATNLPELALGLGRNNVASHVLPVNIPVVVTARVDVGTPDVGSQKGQGPAARYTFSSLPGWELPVDVTVHSGAAGDAGSVPTYTYDFKFAGRTIGTNQLPRTPRPRGEIAAASFGSAFWNYFTQKWELGWCNEGPTVEACSA